MNLEEAKNEIVDKSLVYALVPALIVYAIDLYHFDPSEPLFSYVGQFLVAAAFIWISLRRKKLSLELKSTVCLTGIVMMVVIDIYQDGLLSVFKVLLVMTPFFVITLQKGRYILLFYLAIITLTVLAALLHVNRWDIPHLTGIVGFEEWFRTLTMILVSVYVVHVMINKFRDAYEYKIDSLTTKNLEIEEKEKALSNYKNDLEKQVVERTKALRTANRQLSVKAEGLNVALSSLSKAQDHLIHSKKMASLGLLASGVAHEINNPLNHIQGGVTLLDMHLKSQANHKQDEEVERLISEIKEGVRRAANIVKSLNQYGSERSQLTEKCDLHEIIETCLSIMRGAGLSIENVEKHLDATSALILGNSGKLQQVIINLLTNAMHAIEGKGLVRINTTSGRKNFTMTIIDDGSGMSKETLKRIYEPFFTTKEAGQGTGLGLYITFGIVEEHDGLIEISSELRKGTEVKLTFPLAKADRKD